MRISDWSSDVCSSDLDRTGTRVDRTIVGTAEGTEVLAREAALRCHKRATVAILIGENEVAAAPLLPEALAELDRKSVVQGKSVSVRVDLGGRRPLEKTRVTEMEY